MASAQPLSLGRDSISLATQRHHLLMLPQVSLSWIHAHLPLPLVLPEPQDTQGDGVNGDSGVLL